MKEKILFLAMYQIMLYNFNSPHTLHLLVDDDLPVLQKVYIYQLIIKMFLLILD